MGSALLADPALALTPRLSNLTVFADLTLGSTGTTRTFCVVVV